jgi:hypothetical protein
MEFLVFDVTLNFTRFPNLDRYQISVKLNKEYLSAYSPFSVGIIYCKDKSQTTIRGIKLFAFFCTLNKKWIEVVADIY